MIQGEIDEIDVMEPFTYQSTVALVGTALMVWQAGKARLSASA